MNLKLVIIVQKLWKIDLVKLNAALKKALSLKSSIETVADPRGGGAKGGHVMSPWPVKNSHNKDGRQT